jgi:ribosome-associated heat shock protein Hsp15
MPQSESTSETPRADKWLWAIRVFKTRSLATTACRNGFVTVNGQLVKPSREVRVGEVFQIRQGDFVRTFKALAPLDRRVGAKVVPQFAEDLTPASEYLKQMQKREAAPLKREPGAGRPTKRERREIGKFLGE